MRTVRIGLLGLGTVGQGLLNILRRDGALLTARSGIKIEVVRIVDRSWRSKQALIETIPASGNPNDILEDREIEILVELVGGIHPAYDWLSTALKKGKSVVTANKALLASHGNELFRLARKLKREICFEAAVAGALPIVQTMRRGLVANQIEAIYAILNSTSNYILSRMIEQELDFDLALKEAQSSGFAEADPSLDIAGHDSAQKLAILSALAFDTSISQEAVSVDGIDTVQLKDVKIAESLELSIRPLAIARREQEGSLYLRVQTMLLPKRHLFASVQGARNAILLKTINSGQLFITGEGAGSLPTASSVISDIVFLARKREADPEFWISNERSPSVAASHLQSFYLRFSTQDRPGVLADLTHLLAENNISVASLRQQGRREQDSEKAVDIVILTHPTYEEQIMRALKKIEALPDILGTAVAIPLLEEL